MLQEHIDYIVSNETIIDWAGLSLNERVVRFHRRFPDKRITWYRLRKVYYQHGIKKKKIVRTKIIQKDLAEKIRKEAIHAKSQLREMIEQGYLIIYVDEFMTTKSTLPTHDWTAKNHNF